MSIYSLCYTYTFMSVLSFLYPDSRDLADGPSSVLCGGLVDVLEVRIVAAMITKGLS